MDSEILTACDENVGFITFNRPHLHNAISLEMWNAIPDAIERLRRDGARVIVFTGAGDSFASGADLEELRRIASEDDARKLWQAILGCLEFLWSCEVPTIAMIHGSCIGGGCLLATSCDFRLSSLASSFAIPVARLGLLLDDRTVSRIVASGGTAFARELLLAGDTVSSRRAERCGFLHRAVELNKLRFEVVELAKTILRNEQSSVHALKRAINESIGLPAAGADDAVVASYLTDEFRRRVKPSN